MRKKKQILALLLALAMLVGMLAGCGSTAEEPVPPADTQGSSAIADEPEPAAGREITDMAGRAVTVPEEIVTVFSTDPTAAIYMYTIAPDLLLGWNYELNDIEKSIILEKYHTLPNFGMADAINYEAVIAANPTIALTVTAINDGTIDEADQLSESLGIPVVMVSNGLSEAPAVYRFLGELFGMADQAEQLATYAENTFNDIAGMEIAEEDKVSVYYGNGETSLETAPVGSQHAQIIDMLNAVNVADLELGDGSRVQISAEQLLAWDPDIIIVNGEPKSNMSGGAAAEAIMNNPDFATLKAVQNQMVFGTPNAPFSWVDRPPGPNRIVGMRWLAKKIYPDYFDYDADDEVRTFFSLFYHTELTDEQLASLYAG